MPKVKVSEVTPVQLDWLVARCLGKRPSMFIFQQKRSLAHEHNYSTDWAQGGPIIEAEGISLLYLYVTEDPFRWAATEKPTIRNVKPESVYGPTALIALARNLIPTLLEAAELLPALIDYAESATLEGDETPDSVNEAIALLVKLK